MGLKSRKLGRNSEATKKDTKQYKTMKEALAEFTYDVENETKYGKYVRKQRDMELVGKIVGGKHARALIVYTEQTGDQQVTESLRSIQFKFDPETGTLSVVRDMKYTPNQSMDEMVARFDWHTLEEMDKIIAILTAKRAEAHKNS